MRRRRHFPSYWEVTFWASLGGLFLVIAVVEQSGWRVMFAVGFLVVVWVALWWHGVTPLHRSRRS